jgi:hypothetical protein
LKRLNCLFASKDKIAPLILLQIFCFASKQVFMHHFASHFIVSLCLFCFILHLLRFRILLFRFNVTSEKFPFFFEAKIFTLVSDFFRKGQNHCPQVYCYIQYINKVNIWMNRKIWAKCTGFIISFFIIRKDHKCQTASDLMRIHKKHVYSGASFLFCLYIHKLYWGEMGVTALHSLVLSCFISLQTQTAMGRSKQAFS